MEGLCKVLLFGTIPVLLAVLPAFPMPALWWSKHASPGCVGKTSTHATMAPDTLHRSLRTTEAFSLPDPAVWSRERKQDGWPWPVGDAFFAEEVLPRPAQSTTRVSRIHV